MRSNGRAVWLCWWLGVLVAGCATAVFSGSTSQSPTPALLSLTFPFATPTPVLRLLRTPTARTLTPLATNMVGLTWILPTPLPIPLASPTCYETPVGSLWCLGIVHNGLAVAVGQLIVRVYLVNAEGTGLVQQDTALSLPVLLPDETVPYGVLFESIPDGSLGPVAILASAVQVNSTPNAMSGNAAENAAAQVVPLTVTGFHSEQREAVFHVTGTLLNPAAMPVHQPALVVTLFDAAGRVTGFQQMNWPSAQTLSPGGTLPFELDAMAQGVGTVRAEAHAEAIPS